MKSLDSLVRLDTSRIRTRDRSVYASKSCEKGRKEGRRENEEIIGGIEKGGALKSRFSSLGGRVSIDRSITSSLFHVCNLQTSFSPAGCNVRKRSVGKRERERESFRRVIEAEV